MTVYLVIGVVGLVLLLFSLLAGDMLDGLFDSIGAGWFSGAALAGFLAAFGFGATLFQANGSTTELSVAIGIGAGVVVAAFALWLTRLLRRGGTDDTLSTDDVIGYDGFVVAEIPETGFGVVSIAVGGHLTRFNATSDLPVDAGTRVTVTGVLSPTAVTVAPF